MRKLNLFTTFFNHPDPNRAHELHYCKTKNNGNYRISNVIDVKKGGRPTFNDFFKATQAKQYAHDINIIANSDIVFDETLDLVRDYEWDTNICMALARWDMNFKSGDLRLFDRPDSQDTWIFLGGVPVLRDADFTQGLAGCDNKIAWILEQADYRVINPSKDIRTIHIHKSEQRDYIDPNTGVIERIPPPYKLIHPHKLNE